MASIWAVVSAGQPPRGSGTQAAAQFRLRSLRLTTSWGAQPGTASFEFVTPAGDYAPLAAGADLRVTTAFGHFFCGLCKSDTAARGSGGKVRTLEFVDYRELLAWDYVFGAFNQVDKRIVGGRVVKRYKHLRPANYDRGVWTYTASPYSAARIIQEFLGSASVQSPWLDQMEFHNWQGQPVLDLDCGSGKTVAAMLLEVGEKQGLTFAFMPIPELPYRLVWARKGVGGTVSFPPNSDNHRVGVALSGNPSRVRVLGGRNRYQVLNVGMVPDWNPAWEAFYDRGFLENYIFRNLKTEAALGGIPAGSAYNAIPNDPDQAVGRQLAIGRAATITVGQFASELVAEQLPDDFFDARMFGGRSRNEIPAALYIDAILFRAFRPGAVVLHGQSVPLESVKLVGEMLVNITHDPGAAHAPIAREAGSVQSGNGYAVVRGYNVGADLFKTLRPNEFKLGQWLSHQQIWQHVPFQIDDSGENGGFIIFDDPIIRSDDLVEEVNGFAVLKAAAIIRAPEVSAALTFEAERFSFYAGATGNTRDAIATEPELRGEYVVSGSSMVEIPFEDGQFTLTKATQLAASLLEGPFVYDQGGYTRKLQPGDAGTSLTPVIDRLTLVLAASGFTEDVDFTTERSSGGFTPTRDYERRLRERSLLPGESELRDRSNLAELTAVAFKQNPGLVRTLTDALRGSVGSNEPRHPLLMESGVGTIPVGTPLFAADGRSRPPLPSAVTDDHPVFLGVSVRQSEDAEHPFEVQKSGVGLVRVKGPVALNAPLVRENGADYLVAGTLSPAMAAARMEVTDESVVLIEAALGGGGGGAGVEQEARWA